MMATAQLKPPNGVQRQSNPCILSWLAQLVWSVPTTTSDKSPHDPPSANRRKKLSYPPSADREKNRLTTPSPPTEGELPSYPTSADRGITRLTTIPQSTVLVGLLCCAEFQVAASEGAKNDKKSCDRHRHVVALVNAGSRFHCCVMFITGESSCCDPHCTSRSCPPSRCDHHIVAVVPLSLRSTLHVP